MTRRVYVASAFEQAEEVRGLLRLLRAEGHTITEDWTAHRQLSAEDRSDGTGREYATRDIEGVRSADTFVLLLGNRKSIGSHVELGTALAFGSAQVFVVGGDIDDDGLFYSYPGVLRLHSTTDLLAYLRSVRPVSPSPEEGT